MTTISYSTKELLIPSFKDSITEFLNELQLKGVIILFQIKDDELTFTFVNDDPERIFQFGVVIGLKIALLLPKTRE